MELARPSGRNKGGYGGETIDLRTLLRDIATTASRCGWLLEELPVDSATSLLALKRSKYRRLQTGDQESERAAFAAPVRVYISAGIHGDEPAGPKALLSLLAEDAWPPDLELWLCPCLNPLGFLLNRRENAQGADLNRQYHNPGAEETRTHIAWLRRQPNFDLCLCLHEDWEAAGFYLYELNPDNRRSLADAMIHRVSSVCPVDHSELIEGRAAQGGIVRPDVDPRTRPQWPEAFYLLTNHTRLSYTLEAPSDFALGVRVTALTVAVKAALELVSQSTR